MHTEGGKIAKSLLYVGGEAVKRRAAALHNLARAYRKDEYHNDIKAKLHNRAVESKESVNSGKVNANVLGCCAELLLLVFFSYEGFNNSHTLDIFLDGSVKVIVLLKHLTEHGHSLQSDSEHGKSEDRNNHNEDPREIAAGDKRSDNSEDEHKRRTYRHSDYHHIRALYVVDVRRKSRYERRSGKSVNILERKILHCVVKIMSEILCKAAGRFSGSNSGNSAECQRKQSQQNHYSAVLKHSENVHGLVSFDKLNHLGNNEGNNTLKYYLKKYQ